MKRDFVKPVFNRRKDLEKRGYSKVELLITFSRTEKKYISIKDCNEKEWQTYQHSAELRAQIALYNDIVNKMREHNEEMTVANFNERIGISERKTQTKAEKNGYLSQNGFITFMRDELAKENVTAGTRRHKTCAIDAIEEFGKLSRFVDLTPKNVKEFDDTIKKAVTIYGNVRTESTVYTYHKVLKQYCKLACQYGYIQTNPYDHPICHFKKGDNAERHPLTEAELHKLISMQFTSTRLETARDLFIFSAYTGLAYADAQRFDFGTMAEKVNDTYFIDGSRVKTGQGFYTPILPPALEVLKKYDYRLPKISNQKLNDNLHIVESYAGITKSMTSHIARHSFATLLISYGVPIENVAKMLGHSEIRTTQIYAKVMKETVEKFTKNLLEDMSREKKKRGRPRTRAYVNSGCKDTNKN